MRGRRVLVRYIAVNIRFLFVKLKQGDRNIFLCLADTRYI
jgi:hypothetical protein